ncbi:PLP-dependent aminotransferase family protein [Rhodobacteraceae bacterium]|nr:PLP-dependent aminotransferase family protein [Paracoccaceae bacterium]
MKAATLRHAPIWAPDIARDSGPLYMLIADALERDMRTGVLAPGAKLPAHRVLGDALGVDFTTITRAYTEARRRGLIEGRAGQGTFVLPQAPVTAPSRGPDTGAIDMTMNLPPRFENSTVSDLMWSDIAALGGGDAGLETLLQYHVPGGTLSDREVGAGWLSDRIPGVSAHDVLLTSGAQGAIFALFAALVPEGGTILSANLTYPGMITAAEYLRLRTVGLQMDTDGILPDAFEEACRVHPRAVLYINPTLHNPTAITMSLSRRKEILRIAQEHAITIIEDDAYGALVPDAPPPLRVLAPDAVFYIAGLAKCLSPALRVSYLVMPKGHRRQTHDIETAIRATAAVVSSLTAAVAAKWITSGTAARVIQEIRTETRHRHALGLKRLPEVFSHQPEGAFHVWLNLPDNLKRADFQARLGTVGVGVVPSDAFAIGPAPEAVRLSLGAAKGRVELERGLRYIADALHKTPQAKAFVV